MLAKITNLSWVLWECHARIPKTYENARLLLTYGLDKTIPSSDVESDVESDDDALEERKQVIIKNLWYIIYFDVFFFILLIIFLSKVEDDFHRQLCLHRIILLQYLDRLDTYFAIYGGTNTSKKNRI